MSVELDRGWLKRPVASLNALTLKAAARAIGPSERRAPAGLDEHVLNEIEAQLAAFPRWHRVGFRAGLIFLELGGALGAWGLLPFSSLSRERAGARFEQMMHSRLPPVRLFCHSLKMLVCLSAYGHPEVEASFGFPRRQWREGRVALHDGLISLSERVERPPTPEPSADPKWLSEGDYLRDDAHELLSGEGGS